MNDKIVINTISTIYFITVSILSFIFLFFSLAFIVLQNGIYIDDISVPNVKVKQLYIKWDEKINISIKDINIIQTKNTKTKIEHEEIQNLFAKAKLFVNWFESVTLQNIQFNDITASFKYSDRSKGFLLVSSKNLSLKSLLYFDDNMLVADIENFNDKKRKIKVDGKLMLSNKLEITALLNAQINNEVFLTLKAFANKDKLLYKLDSKKSIKKIEHLINIANLPKEVRYWAFDAIKMSHLKLLDAHGWINYDDIGNAYKNIYIDSYVADLHYTYNSKLDAIHSPKTLLQFKKGKLLIYPKKASSYKHNLDKSWISVDFTKKEELLNLYLLFEAKLDKNMLKILNAYKIKLPFLQKKGKVRSNLNISVGLRNIDVNAKGDFFTKKANFDYLGLNIDIFDAYIKLNNYDVKINKMFAKYQDIAKTKVSVTYNAKSAKGKINFKVKDISFKKQKLFLKTKNLNVVYNIVPNKDFISISKSKWNFLNESIEVEKLKLPFDLDTLLIDIPTTLIKVKDMATLYASGKFDVKTLESDIDVDLLSFKHKGIKLAQSNTQAKVIFRKNIKINFQNKTLLNFDKMDFSLDKLSINILDKKIKLKSNIIINDIFKSNAALNYSLSSKHGILSLDNIKISDKDLGDIFEKRSKTHFRVKQKENLLIVNSEAIDMIVVIDADRWFLNLGNLSKITKYSKLLKKAKITNGDINVNKFHGNTINYNSSFKYPHKLLVLDNKPISNYDVYGTYDTKKNSSLLHINNIVHVEIEKDIKIEAQNIGIHIDELINALDNNNSNKNSSSNNNNIFFKAKNSYLYISKNRHVVSNIIEMQYFNKILTAQLVHKKGKAGFKFHNKKFHLYGKGFGDIFMDELFALSKFDGGVLDFSMEGSTREYEGILNIKKTTIVDYKILNNILAFVNTVPSLVTFSLPEYNKKGLTLDSAYIHFTSKNDIFNISDINFDSKELDILGRGTASFKYNSIDIKLNLKTDLGSKASKIPIVGYILFDEDSMSTSMSIKGKLGDPEIKSLIAKEIIVNPLNIIKRTILLPYHLISDINITETEEDFDISE